MTKEQIKEGMRVRFTGDADNFGEDWTVPERDVLGTIVVGLDSQWSPFVQRKWDALVQWDKPVPRTGEWQYYYKAASLSPISAAGF